MSILIPIQYHKRKYPSGIFPKIREAAGNFDVEQVNSDFPFSLHTEYSFTGRKLNSLLLKSLPTIKMATKNNIPQLWFNKKWAGEFADFIFKLTNKSENLKIIEVHPPFSDYCPSIKKFIDTYMVFEDKIKSQLPNVDILVENRFGSQYRGGKFIFASKDDFVELGEAIESKGCQLRMILDVPQLFTRHFGPKGKPKTGISKVLDQLIECRGYVKGMHLWGKRRSDSGRWVSHSGNLDTYFDNDKSVKKHFLKNLYNLFDDGKQRYFVPEVNSGDSDLKAIVSDLIRVGFKFQ